MDANTEIDFFQSKEKVIIFLFKIDGFPKQINATELINWADEHKLINEFIINCPFVAGGEEIFFYENIVGYFNGKIITKKFYSLYLGEEIAFYLEKQRLKKEIAKVFYWILLEILAFFLIKNSPKNETLWLDEKFIFLYGELSYYRNFIKNRTNKKIVKINQLLGSENKFVLEA